MSKRTVVLVLAAVMVLVVFGVVRAQERAYTLDTPTLTATEIDGEIVVLNWSEVEGATRYDLQVWDCVNKWRPFSENVLRTTEAVHTDPADGITYLYTVQALNDRGERSDWAAISKNGNDYDFVRETVNPIPSPDFDVVAQADHIQLRYSNVEEAVGYQARVWYPGAGDSWLWLPEADLDLDSRTVSYFDVQPGVDYYFVMRAYSEDKCGYSDWSGYRLHTFAGSGTTGGGTTDGGTGGGGTTDGGTGGGGTGGGSTTGGEATATPTATSNTGGEATATPTSNTGGPGPILPGPTNTPTPTPTPTGTRTPTATATATATARPLPGSVSLSVVSNQNVSATSSEVQISWNQADPSADCYEVARYYYVLGPGGTRRIDARGNSAGCSTSHSFTGRPASTHRIRVRGVIGDTDVYGPFSAQVVYGPWSSLMNIKLAPHPGSRPNAPTGVTAANVSNGVRVSWTVDPSKTGSRLDEGDIYEHEVARKTSREGRWHVIGDAGRRGPYTDRNVSPGGVYFYRVRSRNIHGYSSSGFSGAHTYTPPATPTPTNTPETTDPPDPEETPDTRTQCEIAGVTCPNPNSPCHTLQNNQVACGCQCLEQTCGVVYLYSLDDASHHRLHEMMAYDEVIGVLYGIEWIETQLENAIELRTHPYYALNEQHALHEHFRALRK